MKRNIGFLFLTVILLSLFSWFIITFPPTSVLLSLVFYVLVFALSLSLLLYIFADIRPSLIFSSGVVIYLLLRSFNLRHPLYGILLLICCFSILRLFPKPKK